MLRTSFPNGNINSTNPSVAGQVFWCAAPFPRTTEKPLIKKWQHHEIFAKAYTSFQNNSGSTATIFIATAPIKATAAEPRNICSSSFEPTEKQRQRRDNICSKSIIPEKPGAEHQNIIFKIIPLSRPYFQTSCPYEETVYPIVHSLAQFRPQKLRAEFFCKKS